MFFVTLFFYDIRTFTLSFLGKQTLCSTFISLFTRMEAMYTLSLDRFRYNLRFCFYAMTIELKDASLFSIDRSAYINATFSLKIE